MMIINDTELERLVQSAHEEGDTLSQHLATWRESALAGHPADDTHTACLTAALVPVADTVHERSRQTSVEVALREAVDILRGLLERYELDSNRD